MTLCTVVVTGAPLAARSDDLVTRLQRADYGVELLATDSARDWVDIESVAIGTHSRIRTSSRDANSRARLPDALVLCPATFNTINKVAVGIADTRVHSFLAECVAEGTPTIIVPTVNSRLWKHPAFVGHLNVLTNAGATLLDVHTGQPGASPVMSGGGSAIVAGFDPQWIVEALAALGPGRSGLSVEVPPAGFEPALPPPEGGALSPELRGPN